MNDTYPCGSPEALVTYLYDEGDAAEREAIAAHVASCASCAEEIESLRETRMHLSAWTPPALPLGFQITRTESDAPAKVLRPAAWWRQPLPAWAQAAAAVLIFAAGMTLGTGRSAGNAPVLARTDPPAATRPVSATAPSRDELARLDARLRAVEATQTQRVSASPRSAVADQDAMLMRVNALIDERIAQSERRQQIDNVRLLADVARGLDVQHQATLRGFDEELQETRQAVKTLGTSLAQRVSFQPGR
jgi:hypothetical protein